MSRLSVNEDGLVVVSPDLAQECADWSISIHGRRRDSAIAYLDGQVRSMNSDGVECNYNWAWKHGPCICARLLMMLHDISEEEATREMFRRLQTMRGLEVKGR